MEVLMRVVMVIVMVASALYGAARADEPAGTALPPITANTQFSDVLPKPDEALIGAAAKEHHDLVMAIYYRAGMDLGSAARCGWPMPEVADIADDLQRHPANIGIPYSSDELRISMMKGMRDASVKPYQAAREFCIHARERMNELAKSGKTGDIKLLTKD
jgi:hypothetical protein